MTKYLFFFFCLFDVMPAWAMDCLRFKQIPRVLINTPDWSKTVVQPRAEMDLWHGNVVATLADNYDIIADVNPVDGGFCVGLKTVDAVVGYSDFVVQIDIRHTPNTCPYNAILAHEDMHIKTYLAVIDDFKAELQNAVYGAADSVMPIFVRTREDVNAAIDMMNDELQAHPELILVKQKIKAAEEIRNKQIDQNETGVGLRMCFD